MLSRSISTLGERDAEYLRGLNGIISKCLVEIPHTKKQDSIGMLLLKLHILLHQWGLCDTVFSHGMGGFFGNVVARLKSTKKKAYPAPHLLVYT